jgi:acyl carrier protein
MNGIDEFVALINNELGLQVSPDDVDRNLEEVAGWDSVHLLLLLTVLERRTGQQISMPDLLEAKSLGRIYALTTAA